MIHTAIDAFDITVQKSVRWVTSVAERIGVADRHLAYDALRGVLHALRDRLTVDEAAHLGAQLPMLIRGLYYEGWRPAARPARGRGKEQFLQQVAKAFPFYPSGPGLGPEGVTKAVFTVLTEHVSAGEIKDVKGTLPEEIRALWPS